MSGYNYLGNLPPLQGLQQQTPLQQGRGFQQFGLGSLYSPDPTLASDMEKLNMGTLGGEGKPAGINWWGNKDEMGVVPAGIGIANTLMNGVMGFRQLGLAKDQLQHSVDSSNRNFANQEKLINTQLRDRANARYSANPKAYAKPDDYMKENKVGK